ncbi:hypothetical protein C789_4727 [Microcystis aeruginosa FACHB-905 = DIANCHI905]|uniref:Uncharacterized protein n=1 Tax=Microcystis aeruginosa (strain PCC 7806) TaxID=267872 RepID=A8YM13_MICA7|nr:hypothetical protein C789_4727 [Microcystis aeruginosa FACHB-905 = DIANCHI905]CAO91232.1 unnamed protein product [Microcystis aeruginosa PCC 7806]
MRVQIGNNIFRLLGFFGESDLIRDLRFDNVPFGRTQFAPTLWTKSVTVGAQSLRPPIDQVC